MPHGSLHSYKVVQNYLQAHRPALEMYTQPHTHTIMPNGEHKRIAVQAPLASVKVPDMEQYALDIC